MFLVLEYIVSYFPESSELFLCNTDEAFLTILISSITTNSTLRLIVVDPML